MDSSASEFFFRAPLQQTVAGDATLAWRRYGEGPALVLVHGFPLHGYTWRHLLPALASRYACYVVDLAGLGGSDWDADTDFSFPAQARRLRLWLEQLQLDRYSLLAQDTGATIARCLALEDATRVERLMLINTEIPGHRPPWIREYQWLMRLPGTAWSFRQLLRQRLFLRSGMGFGGCFRDLDLIDGEFHAAFIEPLIASAHRTEGMGRYLLGIGWDVVDGMAENHGRLRLPVQLIWGEDDPTFPIGRARAMLPQFADGRGLVAIPGTRLLPQEEKPAAVAAAVQAFMDGGRGEH